MANLSQKNEFLLLASASSKLNDFKAAEMGSGVAVQADEEEVHADPVEEHDEEANDA